MWSENGCRLFDYNPPVLCKIIILGSRAKCVPNWCEKLERIEMAQWLSVNLNNFLTSPSKTIPNELEWFISNHFTFWVCSRIANHSRIDAKTQQFTSPFNANMIKTLKIFHEARTFYIYTSASDRWVGALRQRSRSLFVPLFWHWEASKNCNISNETPGSHNVLRQITLLASR